MLEIHGNIWDNWTADSWLGITTNGDVKRSGECVMGRGIALQVSKKFPEFPEKLGKSIQISGNVPLFFKNYRLFSFPVKHHWHEKASLTLIKASCEHLQDFMEKHKFKMLLPKPGCGNGKLSWEEVKPVMEKYFKDNDNLVIVDYA